MYVWTVTSYYKGTEELDDISEPFVSAEYAMSDWFFRHLNWKHVEMPKFGGAVLEHWQAEDDNYDYILESQYVVGT